MSDESSIHEVDASLAKLSGDTNSTTIIGGDMNFPDSDWKNKKIKPGTPYPVLHQTFNDIMDSHHLVQIIEENTRKRITLDLILTNSPSAVQRVDVLPGV